MKRLLTLVFVAASPALIAQEVITTNLPEDPFANLEEIPVAAEYSREVDRSRGTFEISAADGTYTPGSHFGNWMWKMEAPRWGNYYIALLYESVRPKMGIQIKIGDEAVKGYAPRTARDRDRDPLILGTVYIPKKGEYPVYLLSGDQSNVPAFRVEGVRFIPAPESDSIGQSIDGTIQLEAKMATTYAEMMRYEPQPEKNCLGFWIEKEDWAEWVFDVSRPGTFDVAIHYGCGNGNEGSEVSVLINEHTLSFEVEDTGGFQEWKKLELGQVTIDAKGENRLAVIPETLAKKAVLDIQKIVLTPVGD
ncbi:MAG: hypothetical protein AAF236_03095 [Verrucomicrobiota bacterium]